MSQQTKSQDAVPQNYTIFFNDAWHIPEPAFYWVAEVQGMNPQEALDTNLLHLIQAVREILELDEDDLSDYKIEEALYIVPSKYWMSSYEMDWQARLSATAEL
jgi:hypothetical protein